jgi:hypothetical protein
MIEVLTKGKGMLGLMHGIGAGGMTDAMLDAMLEVTTGVGETIDAKTEGAGAMMIELGHGVRALGRRGGLRKMSGSGICAARWAMGSLRRLMRRQTKRLRKRVRRNYATF